MVSHRLKIRSKTANVAEVNVKKFGVVIKRGVRPGDISGPLSRRAL
ncbi:hypothetical protein E2C01_005597 [Portunus trituberculatus]|uniref:Uncharacterized protein n=1 Tax=Portunus trituberculatus TaxID=210409 RepID=A0A5B7CZK1_PORTR|nr:hypothetical protein [Portunus trituberculatus]